MVGTYRCFHPSSLSENEIKIIKFTHPIITLLTAFSATFSIFLLQYLLPLASYSFHLCSEYPLLLAATDNPPFSSQHLLDFGFSSDISFRGIKPWQKLKSGMAKLLISPLFL